VRRLAAPSAREKAKQRENDDDDQDPHDDAEDAPPFDDTRSFRPFRRSNLRAFVVARSSFGSAVVHCPKTLAGGPLSDRLDESKIEQLRAWGAGLVADGNYELRATGKAILLLIEEIERLHVDLWNAKTTQEQDQPDQADGDGQVQASLDRSLRARLSRVRGR
jgi:hypothetical protein